MLRQLATITLLFLSTKVILPQSSDIVERLLPDGEVEKLVIPKADQLKHVVQRLQVEKKAANGLRAQKIAFILAAFKVDYQNNRDYLLHIYHGCSYRETRYSCNEDTGGFLVRLYQLGHKEVLTPLLRDGNKSDAALSELIGSFAQDVLIHHSDDFLNAISQLQPRERQNVCYLAGGGDGGGIAPTSLVEVRKILHTSTYPFASTCLLKIEAAAKEADVSNQ